MKLLSEIKITDEIKDKAFKCNSPEELISLAQVYDVELSFEKAEQILKHREDINELNELKDEDLEQITGGDTHAERTAKDLPAEHGKFLERYESENYIGQKVYVVHDGDTKEYYSGILLDSYEDEVLFWISERIYVVLVENQNDYEECLKSGRIGKKSYFKARSWSLYLLH